jgi:hypothetical protein
MLFASAFADTCTVRVRVWISGEGEVGSGLFLCKRFGRMLRVDEEPRHWQSQTILRAGRFPDKETGLATRQATSEMFLRSTCPLLGCGVRSQGCSDVGRAVCVNSVLACANAYVLAEFEQIWRMGGFVQINISILLAPLTAYKFDILR